MKCRRYGNRQVMSYEPEEECASDVWADRQASLAFLPLMRRSRTVTPRIVSRLSPPSLFGWAGVASSPGGRNHIFA